MTTTSMEKDFVIKDKKAFEQLQKAVQSVKQSNIRRKTEISPSLLYGEEKLKHFSFR